MKQQETGPQHADPQPNDEVRDLAGRDWRPLALEFSERMGRLSENQGHPRMLGRVVGYLMVCDPPHQTIAQIARALKASNSAVHAVVRALMDKAILDKVTFPGERSAYYRIPEDAATRMFRNSLPNITALRQLAEDGLRAFAWRRPDLNRRLEAMYELHAFFEREMPLLIERWEQKRLAGRGEEAG